MKHLLAKEMGAIKLLVKSDSTLVTGQVKWEFQARDPQLARYLEFVQIIAKNLISFEFVHIPKDQNYQANFLSKLASYTKHGQHKSVIRETLISLQVEIGGNHQIIISQNGWRYNLWL